MTSDARHAPLDRACAAARAHADAADAVAQLVERIGSTPGPGELAECATLLSREESTLRERTASLHALGLDVASISEDDDASDRR